MQKYSFYIENLGNSEIFLAAIIAPIYWQNVNTPFVKQYSIPILPHKPCLHIAITKTIFHQL